MTDGIIKVGAKTYYLKFDINTICNLSLDGINVLTLDGALDFVVLRALLFHGLQGVHRKEVTSVEDAGDVMSAYLENGGDLGELAVTISNALVRSLGQTVNADAVEGK